MVYRTEKLPKRSFVPGRFAMTCCVDDVAFIGFLCKVGENVGSIPFEALKNRCNHLIILDTCLPRSIVLARNKHVHFPAADIMF